MVCLWIKLETPPGRVAIPAEALREKIQSPMTDYEQVEYQQFIARVRSMAPETELKRLWTEGKAMSMEQAIEFAINS